MSKWNFISVNEQYARFPELQEEEVKKLQEWVKLQPHLPNISGKREIRNSESETGENVVSSCANYCEAIKYRCG